VRPKVIFFTFTGL
jgi:hypothetical protein